MEGAFVVGCSRVDFLVEKGSLRVFMLLELLCLAHVAA